ncbi:sodium-dependent proline transporter-like [Vespa mandarinia]|uniref:sodium-dependent proline transporter-like n=1 Tax=Vespa mandarinia TaxID=7446 RepID=UPI001620A197|nr:sodium-dependent proline transporter-like [Vespa mandarinia]
MLARFIPYYCSFHNLLLQHDAPFTSVYALVSVSAGFRARITRSAFHPQGVFVYQMYTYEPAKYGEYVFPGWANMIGILIGVSTIAPFPIFFSVHLWKLLRDSDLFRPTESWGPAIKRDNSDTNSIITTFS